MKFEQLEIRRVLAGDVDLNRDTYTAYQNGDTIELDVLANDVFADDYTGLKEISAVSFGSNGGRISIADDAKSLFYRPPADFSGREEFNYFVDGEESARVRVNVKSPLKDDRFSLSPDNLSHTLDVLSNDPFWDEYTGDRIITSVSTTSADSEVVISPDRKSLIYTPQHSASGHHDQITYIVDGKYAARIEVRLRVVVKNDDFEFFKNEGAQTLDVLRNDRFWADYDGPRKITHVVHETDHGSTVTIAEDGSSLLYTQPTDESSYDRFRYVVDGKFESWVSIHIPHPVNNDHFNVEANSERFRLRVLTNDRYWSSRQNREIDVVRRVASVGESIKGGVVEIDEQGRYVYYSPPKDFVGDDEFTYTADSGHEALVRINVEPPVNDDHVQAYQGLPNQRLRVLRNDFPGDGYEGERKITDILDEDPHADIRIEADEIYYQSSPDFVGRDEFTYTIDGEFDATVYVDVIPLADPDHYDLCPTGDNSHTLSVLRNDNFRRGYEGPKQIDDVEILSGDGEVAISEDGQELVYSAGHESYAQLRYTVDGNYQAEVSVHHFNWLESDRLVVDQNSSATSINLLANDFQSRNYYPCRTTRYSGERQLSSVSATERGGLVKILADGKSVEYTPPRDFAGSDSFTYRVDDTMEQTVYVEVVRYVEDDRILISPGESETLYVQANDLFSTSYLGARMITEVTPSQLGATVAIGEDGRSVVYTAAGSATGSETLTYTIDNQLKAEIEITVRKPNDDLFPQFASLDEYEERLIEEALERNQHLFGEPHYTYGRGWGFFGGGGWGFGSGDGGFFSCDSCSISGFSTHEGSSSHSDTNVQVEGIDEADIVEFDSGHVYFLTGQDLVILDAWPADTLHEVSRVEIQGDPVAQFLDGDRLTVISTTYDSEHTTLLRSTLGASEDSIIDDSHRGSQSTIVTVLDVQDRTTPQLVQRTSMEGRYLQSRAIGEHVYIVLDTPSRMPPPLVLPGENPDPEDDWREFQGFYETESQYIERIRGNLGEFVQASLPSFYAEGRGGNIVRSGLLYEPEDLIKPNGDAFGSLISLVSINAHNSEPGLTSASGMYTDGDVTVYASLEHFYVFQPDYRYGGVTTNILQFDWDHDTGGVQVSSTGYVPGTMLNQFSADEYEGHLRIVTTLRNPHTRQTETDLFVLKDDDGILEHTGSLQSLGVGETAQSVRFMGPRAFVVTFQNVDPLFGLDVSDPTDPKELGHLTITGFSTYMQLIDENHILAVGRNTPNGFSGPAQVSLFNVSDLANPYLVDEFTMERFAQSEAGFDHHAFGYFSEHGLLAVPMSRSFHTRIDNDEDGYAETRQWTTDYQLMVFGIDVEAEPSTDLGVNHVAEINHESLVRRSGYIGDYLYSVAENSVQVSHVGEPGVVLAKAGDLRREEDYGDIELPSLPTIPELVNSARVDIIDRLSLESGNAVPVAAEFGPDGWQAVLRVDNAYFRYAGAGSELVLDGAGFEFKPAGAGVSWVNPTNAADVDGDGMLTPGDALAVIDFLGGRQSIELATESVLRQVLIQDEVSRGFYDVNADSLVSPLDVVLLVEKLNESGTNNIELRGLDAKNPTSLENQAAVDELYARILDSAGDTNGDGVTDFADFLIVAENFASTDATYEEGDFDGNGRVDFKDFLVLAHNFK